MRFYATTKRSNDMSNKLGILGQLVEGLLALAATAVSMIVLQLAMVAR
jgi:hypothetical protein